MQKEFKRFLKLYVVCAVLVFGGFYLTALPTIVQILLLLSGVILTIYTLISITKYFIQQQKNNNVS